MPLFIIFLFAAAGVAAEKLRERGADARGAPPLPPPSPTAKQWYVIENAPDGSRWLAYAAKSEADAHDVAAEFAARYPDYRWTAELLSEQRAS